MRLMHIDPTIPTQAHGHRRAPGRTLGSSALVVLLTMASACSTLPATGPASATDEPALGAAQRPAPAATPTLYNQLGGAAGVETLTADFIRELAADERIRSHFRDTDIGRFHEMLQEQMCVETGGDCSYTGDDMRRSHAGLDIDKVAFNAVVEALMKAMDKNDIPQGVQNQLLSRYAPMRKDIIER